MLKKFCTKMDLLFYYFIIYCLFLDLNSAQLDSSSQAWQERYLKKYNYLGNANPDPRMGALVDVKARFSLAVKMFQKMAGLAQTGEMNEETRKMMEKPRCGNPDLVSKTSITRRKRYTVVEPPWPKKSLTYRISNYSPDLDSGTIRREIYNAFSMWSNVSALTFNEVSQSTRPELVDIDISFVRGRHADGYDFDGPGGTLAHAFFPTNGDAHFDEDEFWTSREAKGVNLLQVAVHEFGHSLGLGHSEVQGAIMAPYYTSYTPNPALHQDDIRGIQQLYGPPRAASTQRVTRFVLPTTKPAPTRTPAPAATTPKPPVFTPPTKGLCDQVPIDAIFAISSSIFIFKGDSFYLMTGPVTGSVRQYSLKEFFLGAPTSIDGATYINTVPWYTAGLYEEGDILIFKNSQVWRFTYSSRLNSISASQSNPQPISADFNGLPSKIDTAFVWSGNGKLYFTKDGYYYGYSPNRRAIGSDYPRTMNIWQGVPKILTAAFSYNPRHTNARTYFFDKDKVYKFNDNLMKVETGYPVKSIWFFGCEDNPKSGNQVAVSVATRTRTSILMILQITTIVVVLFK